MKRRQFSLTLVAGLTTVTGITSLPAFAQKPTSATQTVTPVEGKNYFVISPAMPNEAPEGKIQVLEFFAYSCGHCYNFMPTFEAWAKKQDPNKVQVQRVPVSFREIVEPHARLYYTLEAIDRLDLHEAAFKAILVERIPMISNTDISAFFEKNGVDVKEAMNIYNSFGIQAKVQQANKTWQAYGVDGTPAMAINGQFRLVGGDPKNLIIADQLIENL